MPTRKPIHRRSLALHYKRQRRIQIANQEGTLPSLYTQRCEHVERGFIRHNQEGKWT
jgi:hypothetical protein